jgi:CheY-like chemotaxis protein
VKETDPVHSDVKEMLRTTERAATLTRKLLEFSRQRLIQQAVVSLTTIVQGMADMLQRVMGGVVELVVELNADVGHTRADVGQIEQVVMNLVINARDAMPDGGKLRLRSYKPSAEECGDAGLSHGRYVALSVSDTGSGISEGTKARMFEPFFTTKPVGRGTGLGLSTVYGIVNQSEGQIRVESELGRGTQFTVYLPLVDGGVQERPSADTVDSRAKVLGTILLVEDDPALRPMMARVLRQEGHFVLEAENAQRARRIIEEATSPIDLLLTDIVMPGENGPQLAEALRSADENLRILYVSGYGKDLVRSSDLQEGRVACLEKPFTPTRLLSAIRGLLINDKANDRGEAPAARS